MNKAFSNPNVILQKLMDYVNKHIASLILILGSISISLGMNYYRSNDILTNT
jgi:hypothetical protein